MKIQHAWLRLTTCFIAAITLQSKLQPSSTRASNPCWKASFLYRIHSWSLLETGLFRRATALRFGNPAKMLLGLLLFAGSTQQVSAQWDIPLPQINTAEFPITDTIYMSPTGNDAAPGSLTEPVGSFIKALQLLPFGTVGIQNGNRYGLIRLLPGDYYAPAGMQQNESQWKQGNTFKNVSVEGMGEVNIHADPDLAGVGHGLRLVGSHFFVRNLRIHLPTGVGLLINRATPNPDDPGPEHILIDGVTVDSTGSHGVLIYNAQYVQVKNTRVLRSSRLHFETLPSSFCSSWPSGLKFLFSEYITVQNCEVAYTRGEGLNFHNCQYGLAEHNRIHDNQTNIYNDNSARLIIRQNYVYNTPGAMVYAYPCPDKVGQETLAGVGMLMGNEGACADASHSPSFQFCSYVECNGLFLTPYRIPTIDSIWVYNNIFHHTGGAIHLWEGSSSTLNPNCIRNVFVFNNDFWGLTGTPGTTGAQVSLFFPSYNFFLNSYGQVLNLQVYGNLFSYDKADFPFVKPIRIATNTIGFFDYHFRYNRWTYPDANQGNEDLVVPELIYPIALDSLTAFTPGGNSPLVQPVPWFVPWLSTDFWGHPRQTGFTNAGAVELQQNTRVPETIWEDGFSIQPNPANDFTVLKLPYLPHESIVVKLLDLTGKVLFNRRLEHVDEFSIPCAQFPKGCYMVQIQASKGMTVKRLVVQHLP